MRLARFRPDRERKGGMKRNGPCRGGVIAKIGHRRTGIVCGPTKTFCKGVGIGRKMKAAAPKALTAKGR